MIQVVSESSCMSTAVTLMGRPCDGYSLLCHVRERPRARYLRLHHDSHRNHRFLCLLPDGTLGMPGLITALPVQL